MTLPGVAVSQNERDGILACLQERIDSIYPGLFGRSIPLTCHDAGHRVDLIEAIQLCPSDEIYCIFEPFPFEVRCFGKDSAIEYFSRREPWEDYDLILTSPSVDWVISLSHNDQVHHLIDDTASRN